MRALVERLVGEFMSRGLIPEDMSYEELAEVFLTSATCTEVAAQARREGVNEGVRLAAELVASHMPNVTGQRVAKFLVDRADRVMPDHAAAFREATRVAADREADR